MRVLGIDPGTQATGFGLVELRPDGALAAVAWGVWRAPGRASEAERLHRLFQAVSQFLATRAVDRVAVERLFFNRNVRTALSVGQARGVVLLAAAQHGLEVDEFTPPEVKSGVVGQGAASKEQVAYMVARLLGISSEGLEDHAADALAVAVCCAHTLATRRRWAGAAGP